jgi:hypothetical protein
MFKIKITILLFALISIVENSSAQQKVLTCPWWFHSVNNLGLLEGETGSSFQLQTINGAQYKSWFVGVGVGIDYYRYRTIPLFMDFRKEFGKSRNKVFIYSDLGINFSWLTDKEKMTYMADDHFGNGFYSDLGLGYKMGIGKNNGLLISLGYSFKKITETYKSPIYMTYNFYATNPESMPDQTEKINYSLNRLSIKIGWEF